MCWKGFCLGYDNKRGVILEDIETFHTRPVINFGNTLDFMIVPAGEQDDGNIRSNNLPAEITSALNFY